MNKKTSEKKPKYCMRLIKEVIATGDSIEKVRMDAEMLLNGCCAVCDDELEDFDFDDIDVKPKKGKKKSGKK